MEVVGSLNVTVDNQTSADFVLSETFQKNNDKHINILSKSSFIKSEIKKETRNEVLEIQNPDARSDNQFISNLSMSLYSLCHGYFNFVSGIEIVGNINMTLDQQRIENYVINETLCKKADATVSFKSNSFLVKQELRQFQLNKTIYKSEEVQLYVIYTCAVQVLQHDCIHTVCCL